MKKILFLILILFLNSCGVSESYTTNNHPTKKEGLDSIKLAKKYAFIQCLIYSYNNRNLIDSIFKKDMSLGMLWDIGNNSIPYIYKELDSITFEYVKTIKPSQITDYEQRKPTLYKCLDYYGSKKTDSIIRYIMRNLIKDK